MKNILLLNPPGKMQYTRDYFCSKVAKTNYVEQPIDFIVLSGILNQRYKTYVLDAIMQGLNPPTVANKIFSLSIDIVIFLSGIVSWKEDFDFLQILKRKCPKLVFIGIGDIFRDEEIVKRIFMENEFLDGILMDFTNTDIVHYIEGEWDKIKNMVYRENRGITVRKKEENCCEFDIPVPKHEFFINKGYGFPFAKKLPYTTILTDYGCLFGCNFCIYNTLGFKSRSLANVFEELEYIHSLGIKELFIKDQCFGLNRERTIILCNEMIKRRWNFSWTCFLRTDLAEKKLLETMKDSGCHTIMFGVESANENILDKYKRGVNKENIFDAFNLCRQLGINTVGIFILGFPQEDKKSIFRTIEFSIRLRCDFASFNLFIPKLSTSVWRQVFKQSPAGYSRAIPSMDQSGIAEIFECGSLSKVELSRLRRLAILKFYVRLPYIIRRILEIKTFIELKILVKNGFFLLKRDILRWSITRQNNPIS